MSNLSDYKKAAQELATPQDKDTTLDGILSNFAQLIAAGVVTSNWSETKTSQDKARQALLQWRDKQIEAVLDGLEATFNDAHIDKVIEAERNKLNKSNGDVR